MLLYLDPLTGSDRAVVVAASEQFGVPVRILVEGDDVAAIAEVTSIVTQHTDMSARRLSFAAAPHLRLLQVIGIRQGNGRPRSGVGARRRGG